MNLLFNLFKLKENEKQGKTVDLKQKWNEIKDIIN